jgi:hypothetical protein
MTNEEIIIKIEEIAEIANFCDKIEAIQAFEPEYRKSSFFKKTKMPIFTLVKEYSLNKVTNFKTIGAGLQEILDSLDVSRIVEILEKFTNMGKADFDELIKETQENGFKEVIQYFTK